MSNSKIKHRIEELWFSSDGFRLRGVLHLPEAERPPAVIGSHGLLSNGDSPKQIALAEACNARGMAYFRFDHRACGQSQGDFVRVTSLEGRRNDLLDAIRILQERDDIGERLGLFGSSMGGAACLAVAAKHPVRALVTFAAPIRSGDLREADEAPDETDTTTPQPDPEMLRFDISGQLAAIEGILILHGEADAVVPLSHAREIYRLAKEPKRLIIQQAGDHQMSDPQDQENFVRVAARWFEERLG